jgi:hypothetical protein
MGLCCYLLLRAFFLGITFDEVWTIKAYATNDTWSEIINLKNPDANNHVLNTLAIKLALKFFPDFWQIARLPNVFGFVLCYFFFYRIVRTFHPTAFEDRRSWGFTIAVVLLFANPFLLDFFGLARGYGLSIGLMMGALYFVLKALFKPRWSDAYGFFLFGAAAIFSNLTLIYFFVAATGIWVGKLLYPPPRLGEKYFTFP